MDIGQVVPGIQFSATSNLQANLHDYLGIERSTFVINPKGILTFALRNVSVKGHANTVLESIKGIL